MKIVKCLSYVAVLAIIFSLIYFFNPTIRDIVIITPATEETLQRIVITPSDNNHNSVELNKTCTEKHKNFVFVKTHKTGTSTTVNILYHFGIVNGLNYAIYPYSHQLHVVKPARLMKINSNETYNIMCQHMVFDKVAIESVMPSNSYYFSLLREPVRAFVSYFIFYGHDNRMKELAGKLLSLDESINSFLDEKSRSHPAGQNSYLISNNINSMSYDLGMTLGSTSSVSDNDIRTYISMLTRRFDLMMILEHLDESLLLLQKDLCWELHDTYYLNRMVSKSNRSHEHLNEGTISRLKLMLTPDVELYNHFGNKLIKRLESMPPHFQDQLTAFKESKQKFEAKCMDMETFKPAVYNSQQHPLTEYGASSLQCSTLAERDTVLTKLVSYLQDPDWAGKPNTGSYGYYPRYRTIESFPRQWKLN